MEQGLRFAIRFERRCLRLRTRAGRVVSDEAARGGASQRGRPHGRRRRCCGSVGVIVAAPVPGWCAPPRHTHTQVRRCALDYCYMCNGRDTWPAGSGPSSCPPPSSCTAAAAIYLPLSLSRPLSLSLSLFCVRHPSRYMLSKYRPVGCTSSVRPSGT
eukprot:scaffold886_cov317-Prasinococcus_capsulatus_cf.AAC.15